MYICNYGLHFAKSDCDSINAWILTMGAIQKLQVVMLTWSLFLVWCCGWHTV